MVFWIFTDIEDGDNSRMVQASCGLRFIQETQPEFLFFLGFLAPEGHGLHGNQAVNLRIASLVDDAHGAAAEFREDLVSAKLIGLGLFHRRSFRASLSSDRVPGRDS